MNIKEILLKTTDYLISKNIEPARYESEMIVSTALNMPRMNLYLKFDKPLKKEEVDKCRNYLSLRAKGEPLAYVLGFKDFYKSTFKVNKNVLIPRNETEILVEHAVDYIKENNLKSVLEFGVGSGCIGVSLLKECPSINYTGLEISQEAIKTINENFLSNGVKENYKVINQDVESWFSKNQTQKYDIILSNPPYIDFEDPDIEESVKNFEPKEALFAKDAGLYFLKQWLQIADSLLEKGGLIIFEMGHAQYAEIEKFSQNLTNKYEISPIKDYNNFNRFIQLKKLTE